MQYFLLDEIKESHGSNLLDDKIKSPVRADADLVYGRERLQINIINTVINPNVLDSCSFILSLSENTCSFIPRYFNITGRKDLTLEIDRFNIPDKIIIFKKRVNFESRITGFEGYIKNVVVEFGATAKSSDDPAAVGYVQVLFNGFVVLYIIIKGKEINYRSLIGMLDITKPR